jgi:PAS domain S-box-containing protein
MLMADAKGKTLGFDPPLDSYGTPLNGRDIGTQKYFRNLVRTRSTVYELLRETPAGNNHPVVAIGEPLLDKEGNLEGLVVGWFDLQSFYSIVSRFNGGDQVHTIADANGLIIADSTVRSDTNIELKTVAGRPDFDLINTKTGSSVEYSRPDISADKDLAGLDEAFLVAHTTLPATGWKVLSKQFLAPLKARLQEAYFNQLVVLILALLVALILSHLVARSLIRPTVELQQSAAALAAGNLSVRTPRRRLITVEYDSLFRSFDMMAERLESTWNRQQELSHEVSITKGELEAIFDAMTDAVVITDPKDFIVRANRAFCKLREIDFETSTGLPLTEVVHPGEDWSDCDVCRARREGRHTVVVRRPAETRVGKYLEIRVDPIFNATGDRIGAVQVVRDLTERRQVEVAAEQASAMLKNLVDAAYDGVFATDLGGRFLWANTRAADLFGFAGLSIEGKSFLQSIHPDDLGKVRSNFNRAANGEAQRYELRCLTPNGIEHHALITNSPIYAENEIAGVLAVMRDITEERMAAEQTMRSDKLRALGQLASGVAHNFNNALTAVLGYTQMALVEVVDPKVTRYLNTVEKAALDAARMVQRVQNFARQRQDESLAPANVNLIVRDALDLTRSRWRDDARATGVEYDIIFRPSEGLMVTCDESALREVFVNIIINALDAMPSGGRLTITATLENNNTALVSFEDNGSGMTEEVRQRIFEPFYTTKGVKGYGMGLAVSFGIIERHGGEIQVKSEPDSGATFTLKLPVARKEAEQSLSEEAPNARTASVLVVDDELPIRTMLADLMRARGHKVLTAEDGLAGLRAIEASRFDLVITDLSMPGADGWTLVNEVRRRWPGTKLVMVTGYGGFADLAISGGDSSLIDALISKPFNIAQIDTTINDLLLGIASPGVC